MLDSTKAFSGFSVNDLATAQQFYGETLGLPVETNEMGVRLRLSDTHFVFMYAKPDHTPASFTVLNFPVDDIETAVHDLQTKGVTLEHYDGLTDASGIMRGKSRQRGPDIAWFKDPAGNILSILQD